MSSVHTRSHDNRKLVVESAAFGLGYTAVLIWSGSALVASFTGGEASPSISRVLERAASARAEEVAAGLERVRQGFGGSRAGGAA